MTKISGVNVVIKLVFWLYLVTQINAFRDALFSCEDGWFEFSESCYYVESELLDFKKAEKNCAKRGGTLFVADSLDELKYVLEYSSKQYSLFWIGLAQNETVENLPRWKTEGGVDPTEINWLIKPYKPQPNGWTSLANCVSYYNGYFVFNSPSYAFYHPCTSMFQSVCERNTTLISSSADYVPYFDARKLIKELTASNMNCSEFIELGGNVMTPAVVIGKGYSLITKSVLVIGRQELRAALNFGPVPPIAHYNKTKPSEEELASAPTLEAYYNLRESRSSDENSLHRYVLDANLTPAVAFLDKKFPSIRALFKRKIQEILQSEGGMNRESIDRWIKEFRNFNLEAKYLWRKGFSKMINREC